MNLKKIIILLFILSTIGIPLLPSESFGSVQSEVEEALICLCGCGQTIKDCPHEKCGFSIPARQRITVLIGQGKTTDEIMDVFVEKYGDEVLAAPKKEGFNLLGYVMPFAALLAAFAFIIIILRGWAAKGAKDEEETLPMTEKDFGSDLDDRVEKELEEMD